MERELKIKLRMLEGKKMSAQVNADKQERFYKLYPYLPLIIFLLIFVAFLTWGLIDSWTHETVIQIEQGLSTDTKTLYGIWKLETRFHVYATWGLIGAGIGAIVWLILKVSVSVRIMTLEYLRIRSINEQIEEKEQLLKKLPPNPDN